MICSRRSEADAEHQKQYLGASADSKGSWVLEFNWKYGCSTYESILKELLQKDRFQKSRWNLLLN